MGHTDRVEVNCTSINMVAPRGYVSVQITVRFAAGDEGRYAVAGFDVPVRWTVESSVEEVRNTALSMVKQWMSPEIARRMPADFEGLPEMV